MNDAIEGNYLNSLNKVEKVFRFQQEKIKNSLKR